ncbi:DUF6089 family protein [Bacteroidota bacterium]
MCHLRSRISPQIYLIVTILCLTTTSGYAQLTDIGFGLGGFNFTGDMTRYYDIKNSRPALSVFMRSNLSDAVGLRYGFTGGQISGSDNDPDDPFEMESFTNYIIEGAANLEYNFLDFKSKHARIHWTPYLYFGAGMFFVFGSEKVGDYSRFQPMLPLGFGFKYSTSPKIDIGVEASARATFFDYIDNNSGGESPDLDYEYGSHYTNDVYYFIGFTLNYTFYFIPCPYGYD